MRKSSYVILFAIAALFATACASGTMRCAATWSAFDCARMQLAANTMNALDHDVHGNTDALWWRDTNAAWRDITLTGHSVTVNDLPEVSRGMDDYEAIVRRSDAGWLDKRRLIRSAQRLRQMALGDETHCPATWSRFDCVRLTLAFDTLDILDHDELGDGRTLWYDVTIPAYARVVSTWNNAALGEPFLISREMDEYEQIVRKSDASWFGKRKLLAGSRRLRPLALAEADRVVREQPK